MKRMLVFLLTMVMALSVSACGNSAENPEETGSTPPVVSDSEETPNSEGTEQTGNSSTDATGETDGTTDGAAEGSNILIAYFSRVGNTDFAEDTDTNASASVVATEDGLQGNTEVLARMIQAEVGGDLFLIETESTYPVSYDETIDVGQQEQSEGARPALVSQVENLDQYDIVFLGFPNWWGDMPMAVYTFLEEYDLSGKTIVPFVTSGGSGFSGTQSTIADLEPQATVLDGLSVRDSAAANAQEDVTSWLSQLSLTE